MLFKAYNCFAIIVVYPRPWRFFIFSYQYLVYILLLKILDNNQNLPKLKI